MLQTRIDDGGRRGGLTRIEVAVLLGVLALLTAFLAPALQQNKRRVARPLECLNNIRQIGIAMHNFASSNGGSLPTLTGDMRVRSDENGSTEGMLAVGWPIMLLPAME